MPLSFKGLTELSAGAGFAGNTLDRLSEKRDDPSFLADMRSQASSSVVLVTEDARVLLRRGGTCEPFFSFTEAQRIGRLRETVLLGRSGGRTIFGAEIDVEWAEREGHETAATAPRTVASRGDVEADDLRVVAAQGLVDNETLGVLAQAKSVVFWHARHRFCGKCGSPTESASAGWRRECPSCGALHFPRTDPVVIMVATDGDACLLGRQPQFAPGMYSALAGFLEPGETIENAVRREVREETGVIVGAVAYLGSQPWPFPSSLMIGCLAQALTRDIVIDDVELEDARWFRRDELRAMFARTHPEDLRAPNSIAIAHRLLEAWLED